MPLMDLINDGSFAVRRCVHGNPILSRCYACERDDQLEATGRSLERSAREPSGDFTKSEPMEHEEPNEENDNG